MQSKNNLIKIITIISFPIILNSCASSSYNERYGSSKKNIPNSEIKRSDSVVEDEEAELPGKIEINEAEYVFQRLSYITEDNVKKEKFLKEIINYLNTPYQYGGNSKEGIDCSAFTQNVFRNSLDIFIPRTAREQYKQWKVFDNENELKFGDLIYFDTSRKYFPGHVGIYLDDNLFAHASSSNGVIISSLENAYYSSKFVGANRVKIKKY
ncbi:MAG: C40 family peptidase [Ignavibacteriales bacterium]|nr:C40 family peptidase [Ignavibacteriales bacterium]